MAKVLVLEDDAEVRALLEKLLTHDGFTVKTAGDGLEGLMQIETDKPDLVLCDLMMPNLDGLSFTRAIKKNAGTKDLPVVFLTAKGDPANMAAGISAGAKFYLTKPFSHAELLAKVRKALGTRAA
jgi:DNA-binding response OmpR family regulator